MYAQIWFFRYGYPKTSQAGYQALYKHKDEIEAMYPELEFTWRPDRLYPAVDVGVSSIGYAIPATDEKLKEVVAVAGVMARIVEKYRDEIANAMQSVVEEKQSK
jgi:hypothetical protein